MPVVLAPLTVARGVGFTSFGFSSPVVLAPGLLFHVVSFVSTSVVLVALFASRALVFLLLSVCYIPSVLWVVYLFGVSNSADCCLCDAQAAATTLSLV